MHSSSEELLLLISTKLVEYQGRKRAFTGQYQDKYKGSIANLNEGVNLASELQKETLLFDQAIVEFDQIFSFLTQIHRQDSSKIFQLSNLVQSKSSTIEETQEKLSATQKQKQKLEEANKHISQQLDQYKKAYEQIFMELQKYKSDSFDQINQQQDRFERQLKQIAQLKQEVGSLKRFASQRSQQIQILNSKLNCIEVSLKGKNQKIINLQARISSDIEKIKKMESIIREKDELISQLEQEIISYNKMTKNPFKEFNFSLQMFSPPQDHESDTENNDSFKNKVKLSEDIQNRPFQYRHQIQLTSLSCLNDPDDGMQGKQLDPMLQKTLSSTPTKIFTKIIKPIVLDPYYCHYVLLSQTIKILQNEEDFFNVDVKPLYKQMISEKIPMFEWREWIVKKMRQICAKN